MKTAPGIDVAAHITGVVFKPGEFQDVYVIALYNDLFAGSLAFVNFDGFYLLPLAAFIHIA